MDANDEECRVFLADGTCYYNRLSECDCWCHTEEGKKV